MSILTAIECAVCKFDIATELVDAAGFTPDQADRKADEVCAVVCSSHQSFTWADVLSYLRKQGITLGGNPPVACTTVHSTKVQGPGLCCQAVQSGALTPPPPGTTLPPYAPGQAATLPPGRIAQVIDSGGHCASCMIVGSSSVKHRGRPVLKFIRGGPGCPSSTAGCCLPSGASI